MIIKVLKTITGLLGCFLFGINAPLIAQNTVKNTSKIRYAQPVLGRAKQQLDAFIPKRLNYFSPNGAWQGATEWQQTRSLEPLALSHALLASGNSQAVTQANFYLSNAKDLEWHRATYIFLKYPALLTEASKKNMRFLLDKMSEEYLKSSWDFVGVNDNFPSMATAGCALYGEISGKTAFTDAAYQRLLAYKRQLIRSGVCSEFSSQAYLFLQIEPMAMLAEFTNNAALKALALEVEAYYWFDALGHFYMPALKIAAPYSRAYAWDMRGSGLAYTMLEQNIGQYLPFKFLDDYFEPSEEWLKCRNAACYGITYHCPEKYVQQLINRKYPYSFIATADGSPSSDDMEMAVHGVTLKTRKPLEDDDIMEYPAWQTRIETYMTEKYALSTASLPFHSGSQSENFLIVYPHKDVKKEHRNTSTIFSRLVINNDETLEKTTDGYGDFGIVFNEKGRRMTLQHQNTAMVLYKPKADFCKNVTSLKTSIYFPFNQWMKGSKSVDELWIGTKKITLNVGVGEPKMDNTPILDRQNPIYTEGSFSAEYETVYVKQGDVFMAFIPLVATKLRVNRAISVENRIGYTIVSFYNYEGEPKNFTKRGFMNVGNGFVCEIASTKEYASFAAFRQKIGESKVTDFYRETIHARSNTTRCTRYEKEGLVLENEYSPSSEGIRFSTLNGQHISKPRLQVSGVVDYPFQK
jgi:hypothetical protein